MSQPAAAAAGSSSTAAPASAQRAQHAVQQYTGQVDDAGNTVIDEHVILAVTEAIALVMDQQLLQRPLAYPAVPFEEVSALLQMKGIVLDIKCVHLHGDLVADG